MNIVLPHIEKLILNNNNNQIVQLINKEEQTFSNCILQSTNPFVVGSNGTSILYTSNKLDSLIPDYDYVILTSKKPRKKDFLSNSIITVRWLKHPEFLTVTPSDVTNSWKSNTTIIKENISTKTKGLRPPQLSALYNILSHIESEEERAIVVMPTGTGKTETMLATLVFSQCEKLLISVPSDSLRTQIGAKFKTLGLLKEFGLVNNSGLYPIVGTIKSKFKTKDELTDFISRINVMVTTMNILADSPLDQKNVISEEFSHFFVDEAHHSEASTWKKFIQKFSKNKVFLFTATPFRNDGKKLDGKFIYNLSLRKAQAQGYYKKINLIPVREYDQKVADQKIADVAISQLRSDIHAGFDHMLMARCGSRKRAKEVFEYYKVHSDLNPVIIHKAVSGLKEKIRKVKAKFHKIIICVDMLGEGFDLPELKVAAVHDERQSLPITLQFIGRFTRTSFSSLGEASFVTNIAYPPISEELNHLYSRDADWNLLLPTISSGATNKEIDFKDFLDGFNNLTKSKIPFQNINPAMSTLVYRNGGKVWNPNKWSDGFPNINSYEHYYSDHNPSKNTLVIVLGKSNNVEWGNFDTVTNLSWDLIVIHWDFRPKRNLIFIHSSLKNFSFTNMIKAIFGDSISIVDGMNVFKIFHNVKRLTLYNVGARKGTGKDISFQSFFGKGVQDGLKLLEQGTLIKNNIFGIGYRNGEKISLGCSVKGKMWSYLRGNLNELIDWCRNIGDLVEDPTINPNTVLKNTLIPITINEKPKVSPICVEWNHQMYQYPENRYEIIVNGKRYDLSNSELKIKDSLPSEPLKFILNCNDEIEIDFEMILGLKNIDGKSVPFYEIKKISSETPLIEYGTKPPHDIAKFFMENTPIFWFADGSQLLQNRYVRLKNKVDNIPLANITVDNWTGVDISKEAQGVTPYNKNSIQYYFINKIKNDYQIIYDDDGSGEIADVIGINDQKNVIDIHLYHLKYAKGGKKGNSIGNFYEVCGQAQKSINWKYRDGKIFFDHLLRRKLKKKKGKTCSRIIKGTEQDLERLLNAAKWTKEMKFHIYIVQPSLEKSKASEDILLLLGNTFQYLHTVANVELKVITS